jgi:signal transduction histidine kinase
MKLTPDRQDLNTYLILSYVVVVLLTAIAVGLPAIFLIQDQLERQAWSQVSQGYRASEALYAAQERELANLAVLTAQRPTLQSLLNAGDASALADYLDKLRAGVDLDLIVICAADHQIVAASGDVFPAEACVEVNRNEYLLVPGAAVPQVLLVAGYPIDEVNLRWVIVGVRLDDSFASAIQSETGLEHIIRLEGEPIASSLDLTGVESLSFTSMDVDQLEGHAAGTFEVGEHPYYAAHFPLDLKGLEAIAALEVGNIAATHKDLILVIVGGILIAAALGALVGSLISKPINRPLVDLASAAANMSRGELDRPVVIESSIREIDKVSQALDRARADLLGTLTELRQEKAWSNHLLGSIVEGIVTLDAENRITYFSRGAERITGWGEKYALERHCDEIFQAFKNELPFSKQIPLPGQKNNISVVLPNGGRMTLAVTRAQLIPLGAGDAQMALVFRDVSEEQAIHRLLGNFIANVAHEFRTPLSALDASIELLLDQREEYSPGEVEELLKSLRLGILSLEHLIDNLLESASIEAGRFRVSPRVYDLREIVTEVVNTMHPLLEKYEQKLIVDLPDSMPLVVADPRRVEQVLVNLLSNANKYGPVDAEIVLRVTHDDAWMRVSVADQGSGIPIERREYLFQRFDYNPTGSLSRKAGAGLGLSVVKAIVEAHGGSVAVEDLPGGGAEFWFTLPLANK